MTNYKMSLLKRIAKYMNLTFEYVKDNELYFTCNEDKHCKALYYSFDHAVGLKSLDGYFTIPLLNFQNVTQQNDLNVWSKREKLSFNFKTLPELDIKLSLLGY